MYDIKLLLDKTTQTCILVQG